MTPIELAQKKKILRKVMSSGLPIKVLPTKAGLILIEKGITEVYIRTVNDITNGRFCFGVSPEKNSIFGGWHELADEDLDLEPFAEGGAANEASTGEK